MNFQFLSFYLNLSNLFFLFKGGRNDKKSIFLKFNLIYFQMKRFILPAQFFCICLIISFNSNAQINNNMYRIAKIKVDINQLEKYKVALKEQMNTAIKMEPGVLSYTVVADKKDLSLLTILEVYANLEAYQSHILTPHFKKYKDTVKDMVLSLELIDTELIERVNKDDF
jgi:quinol monooxygenase YgiN